MSTLHHLPTLLLRLPDVLGLARARPGPRLVWQAFLLCMHVLTMYYVGMVL